MDSLKRLLGLGSSATKGKARAVSPERTSLLSSQPTPTTPSRQASYANSRPVSQLSTISHGRGPLMADSDDEPDDGHLIEVDSRAATRTQGRGLAKQGDDGYGTLPGTPAAQHADEEDQVSRRADRTTRALFAIALALLALAFIALAVVHVYLGHVLHRTLSRDSPVTLARRGLVVQGPDKFSVSSFEDDVIMVRVGARAGVDIRKALAWESKDAAGSSRWSKWEAQLARWAVGKAGMVTVDVADPISLVPLAITGPSKADLSPYEMIAASLPPISVPLFYSSQDEYDGQLRSLDLSIPIRISSPSLLGAFANESWSQGVAKVEAVVPGQISLQIGNLRARGWLEGIISRFGKVTLDGIKTTLEADVPRIPGADDPAALVNLTSYTFFPVNETSTELSLGLNATAVVTNPLARFKPLESLKFEWDVPWRLPFAIYLPSPRTNRTDDDDVLMAHVDILPFHFDKSRQHIPIALSGHLNSNDGDDETAEASLSAALGQFLARFLKGLSSPVRIRYDAAHTAMLPTPPEVLGKLLEDVVVEVPFPGADPDSGQLLRHVTIADMKVSPSGGEMVCSGTVTGDLVLPKELKALRTMLDIRQIMPDVYIYDGALPGFSSADGDYPPSPTPKNAFGRIRTTEYVDAKTTQSADGKRTMLEARLTDVPLELLPGRSDVFRRYLGKLLFGGGGSQGVETGVRGQTSVKARIEGLGNVEMGALPIEGTFYVGGPGGFLTDEVESWIVEQGHIRQTQ